MWNVSPLFLAAKRFMIPLAYLNHSCGFSCRPYAKSPAQTHPLDSTVIQPTLSWTLPTNLTCPGQIPPPSPQKCISCVLSE